MIDEPLTRLFVYGTLKRGHCRSGALLGEQYVGEIRTAPRYRLLNLGSYPGLVEVSFDGRSIKGELWLVRRSCLLRLDEIEAVGEGLYARRHVELLSNRAGRAETYFFMGSSEGLPDCGESWP